jgi:hypothetical protein
MMIPEESSESNRGRSRSRGSGGGNVEEATDLDRFVLLRSVEHEYIVAAAGPVSPLA